MSVGFHAQQVSEMRVLCPHCQNKAVITASNRLSPSVTDLYCRCNDKECQAGFVMTVAHKHDTQPPIHNMKEMLSQLLRAMPSEERNQLMSQFPL